MGFADSPATRTALASSGIRVSGYRWQWGLGLKGGTFPPHLDINGDHAPTSDSFEALPGEDVNGDTCMCQLVPVYRDEAGRFAKPGLEPVFTPPAVASLQSYPQMDMTPLAEFLNDFTQQLTHLDPHSYQLTVPDGAFTINLPELNPTFHVAAPSVTVEAAQAPEVTVQPTFQVESPNVNVSPPTVNVAAPNVTVSPNIEVKPAPVKIIREKVARAVRFRRNANGQITEAEVTTE